MNGLFLLVVVLPFGEFRHHRARIAEKIWSERCTGRSMVLNDCNWCRCDAESKYTCDAKSCNVIDMFGHFNDAIQELHVGMEGHGVWRTDNTPCQPGVAYQMDELLCVCNESGSWPNPVCRDAFRVLHAVEEVVENRNISTKENCSPHKLHLVKCNVCLCPSTGFFDLKYCTNTTCSESDPIFRTDKKIKDVTEVYAECDPYKKYKLGNRNCKCLTNNRLLCNNGSKVSQCNNYAVGESFEVDCNICHCDKNGLLYCTVRKCLPKQINRDSIDGYFEISSTPDHDPDCIPRTKYLKDCNTCFCYLKDGVTKFSCTVQQCNKKSEAKDCVVGSTYAVDCLICQCAIIQGVKTQTCQADPKCYLSSAEALRSYPELDSLYGYCEPLHIYKKDCNTCQCLQDGKTVKCTSKDCKRSIPKPITVDLVPVIQKLTCPKGHSYKIDCNYCICLANGNAICTTNKCEE